MPIKKIFQATNSSDFHPDTVHEIEARDPEDAAYKWTQHQSYCGIMGEGDEDMVYIRLKPSVEIFKCKISIEVERDD